MSEQSICPRCQKPFYPKPIKFKGKTHMKERFCMQCFVRNFHDAMDLPTPPELLDPYTRNPTLTKEEYKRRIKQ